MDALRRSLGEKSAVSGRSAKGRGGASAEVRDSSRQADRAEGQGASGWQASAAPPSRAESVAADPLGRYRAKRDFARTPEPAGATGHEVGGRFIVHKHDARRLHYDLRLELGGTFKSWAVTRWSQLQPEEQAPGGPCRGSSPGLRQLRGHDLQGRVWRRHRHDLGRGHLDACGGRRARLCRGSPEVQAIGAQTAWRMDAGAQESRVGKKGRIPGC